MKNKKVWLGLLVSAVFLYLAFRNSDLGQLWREIRRTDWTFTLAALPFLALSMWLRAVRWRYLLMPYRPLGLHSLFGAVMIGFMSLNVLPLRLGEFVRAYVLGRREALPFTGVFATVVVERIFDGFTVLLMLIGSMFLLPFTLDPAILRWVHAFSYLAVAIYFTAIVFVVLVKWRTNFLLGITSLLLGRFPALAERIERLVHAFAQGLECLRSGRLFLIIAISSIGVWLAAAASYGVLLFGFQGPNGHSLALTVGPVGVLFLLGAIALGVMIPSCPGFVGTFEMAAIAALTALGAERPIAETYAVIAHAVNYLPITLTGIFYLYIQGFSLRQIRADLPVKA